MYMGCATGAGAKAGCANMGARLEREYMGATLPEASALS